MKKIAALLLLFLAAACATNPKIDEGRELIAQGKLEEGLATMEAAALKTPRNAVAYNAWITTRDSLVSGFVREGDVERGRGNFEHAEWVYRRALAIDPTSSGAKNGLTVLERDRRHRIAMSEADQALQRGDTDLAERTVRQVLKENPQQREAKALMKNIAEKRALAETMPLQLKAAMNKPVTLEFRDAPLRSIFEVIARSSGINFVFDRDVRQDLRATIFMRNTNLDEVIRVLLATHQLDRKIMNENSILIYPNTPAKQKDYQELAMRSFYLSNADAKQTAAMIRALVKTRDLYIDEKLNLVVMKDTPDAIRVAEQLVAAQDLGEPEVVLEVEVAEVATSLLQDLGIKYPDAVNFGVLPIPTDDDDDAVDRSTTLSLGDMRWYAKNPLLNINLRKTDGRVNTLANPRIRVKNREKAKIHIGEKVPVITSTVSANIGTSSSVNYLEVGLKLEVEPNVYLDNEVAIKVALEVSNILQREEFEETVAYRVGTRNASTVLRLQDGETQMLAGLINDEDRRSVSKVPLLGDVPLLGRLFRSDSDTIGRTEIVLLITPRVVRNISRPDTVMAQFHSGTDSAPGSAPLRLTSAGPRSFAMTPSGGGGGVAAGGGADSGGSRNPNLPAVQRGAGDDVALAMSGPSEVAAGEEFVLSFGLPTRAEGANVRLQLAYDPKMLSVVSGAAGVPGRAVVDLTAASIGGTQSPVVQVRFRAIAATSTSTDILLEPLSATDNAQRALKLSAPGSHSIAIGAKQAAQGTPAPAPQ